MEWSSDLLDAAHSGKIDKLQSLLMGGCNPNCQGMVQAPIRGACSTSRTALHVAANALEPDCLQLLAQHGGNVNARDEDGYTPAHYVCQKYTSREDERAKISSCLKILFCYGASPRLRVSGSRLSLGDLAERVGNQECAQIVQKEVSKVHSLEWLCRCTVMDHLHRVTVAAQAIQHLPLPDALKSYLELNGVLEISFDDG